MDDIAQVLDVAFAVWEYEIKPAFRAGEFPFLQCVCDELAKWNRSLTGMGLGLADLVEAIGPLRDVNLIGVEIHIGPSEPAQL